MSYKGYYTVKYSIKNMFSYFTSNTVLYKRHILLQTLGWTNLNQIMLSKKLSDILRRYDNEYNISYYNKRYEIFIDSKEITNDMVFSVLLYDQSEKICISIDNCILAIETENTKLIAELKLFF